MKIKKTIHKFKKQIKKISNIKRKHKISKKHFIITSISLVIALAVMVILFNNTNITGNVVNQQANQQTSNQQYVKPVITKANFKETLQQQSIIKELPDDAEISLKLYNFNSGERQWEEEYVIRKGLIIKQNSDNPDMIISIHSKYVSESYNFCNAIKQANRNGDLGYDLIASKASLLWKYKGVTKYKKCLG